MNGRNIYKWYDDKELTSKMYKQLMQLNIINNNKKQLKIDREIFLNFSKEDIQI